MKIIRIMAVLLGTALLIAGTGLFDVRADEWDKATKVTFKETVQVPGTVLPAGTYIFRLYDSPSNRHIVRIFMEDKTTLVTTILAIPNSRLKPTEKTIITYSERPANQPEALNAWFYPGDNFGQQFVYPKSQAAELSRLNHVEVPSTGSEGAYSGEPTSTPVASQRTEVAENREVVPQSSPAMENPQPATPAQSPAYRPTPNSGASQDVPREQQAELPHTASSLPIIALAGFVLFGAALALRVALRT